MTTRLPVRTHHCRFCNHLLLATTRDLASLPRRKDPAQDAALILPLPTESDVDAEDDADKNPTAEAGPEQTEPTPTTTTTSSSTTTAAAAPTTENKKSGTQKHYTILLSTTIPERKPTLIRREDGFEKRLLLRCGRCRVVVGYFLDPVQFPDRAQGRPEGEEQAQVVYLLPGALVETGEMGDEEIMGVRDREWSAWAS